MEKVELEAKKREKVGTTRSRNSRILGSIPAVVYGKGMESVAIEIDHKRFAKIISAKAGRNVIITLNISSEGKSQSVPVLTHDIQINHLNDSIIHVDFYKVKMEEEIKTKIPVILTGESIGVKLDGGILVHGLREIEIKCLPMNIPDKFEIDVSSLKIGNSLHVSDIKIGKDVTVVTLPTEILVTIAAPSKEEEVVAPIAAPEVTGQAVPAAAAPGAPGAPAAAAPAGKEAAPAKGKEAAPAKGKEAAPAKAAAPESKKK
jgi:large subunit ribosomal protein L25